MAVSINTGGTPPDWRVHARAEYRAKRAEAQRRLDAAERAERKAADRAENIRRELADLEAGARAFGLDTMPVRIVELTSRSPDANGADIAGSGEGPTAREIILEALEEAYPHPLRANALKEIVEKRLGRVIHYKTPGMTLYRLAEERKVRREGYNWYLNPPPPDTDGSQSPVEDPEDPATDNVDLDFYTVLDEEEDPMSG